MPLKMNLKRGRVRRILGDLGRPGLERKTNQIAERARLYASPHGSIASKIVVRKKGPLAFRIISRNPHTILVHNGSRAHWIRPVNNRRARSGRGPGYLRFEVGGRTVFAREVFHPGYRGDPFMTDALRDFAVNG